MNQTSVSYFSRISTGFSESISRFPAAVADCVKTSLGAAPIGLRGDILYQWATFRLRHRKIKMLSLVVLLGVVCYAWQWAGWEWIQPRLAGLLSAIRIKMVQDPLRRTLNAMFSSLNCLSCVSILIMARTLRHLTSQGHLEMIMLVPSKIRPSALYYAIAGRYMPLALVAVLVMYLDPRLSPYNLPPFTFPVPPRAPVEEWAIYWSGIKELSVIFFCPANVFMDLALAYWIFCRWRLNYPTIFAAIILIGLVTPMPLTQFYEIVDRYVDNHLWDSGGIFESIRASFRYPLESYTMRSIAWSAHYFLGGLICIAIGFMALASLDFRWNRIQRSPTIDPVLIKQTD